MLPTNSNYTKEGCSPTSSNCVVWQGPNIDCINLCKGDSITDVTFNLANEICDILTLLDISAYDLDCIVPENPEPTDIKALLELLISKVCALEAIEPGEGGGGSEECACDISLAPCLQYTDELGDPVTILPLTDYVTLIGNTLCTNIAIINANSATLDNHETRIDSLESADHNMNFNTVLNGNGTPGEVGNDGDFYIDNTASFLFGPKSGGAWPAGTSLIGPQGATGITGTDGINGVDGNGIVSIVQTSGDGSPGSTDEYTITFDDTSTYVYNVYNGADGAVGSAGDSAYQVWLDDGNSGTETNFLDSLVGTNGTDGNKVRFGSGTPGVIAADVENDVYFDMNASPSEVWRYEDLGAGVLWVNQGPLA